MGSMSIGEVAQRAGVRPSTLRYYESIGVLPTPERENGRRRYDGEVLRKALDRLAVVRVAQQAGFTISEIRMLLDGFRPDRYDLFGALMCVAGVVGMVAPPRR